MSSSSAAFIFLIVFVGFELLSDSDRMELVTSAHSHTLPQQPKEQRPEGPARRDHALGVKLRPELSRTSALFGKLACRSATYS